jgi:RhoGEF, Guanine nucleotide exchange factor for Rho/Rac/Cdc42-like GTPases
VVFALNTDCPELNDSSPEATHLLLKHCTEPVILASPDHQSNHGSHSPYGVSPGSSPSKLRRAKRPTQSIISFDDENRGMSIAKPVEKLPARRDEKTNVLENYSNVLENFSNDLGRDSGASGTPSENGPIPSLPNSNFENSHSFPSQGNSSSFGASPETVSHNASSLAQHNFSSNSSSQFSHNSDRVSSTQGSLERDNNSIYTNSDMSTPSRKDFRLPLPGNYFF